MRRWLPFPLLWLSLTAMWLLLNQSLWIGHALLGGALALVACLAYARLETVPDRGGRSWHKAAAVTALFFDVAYDIVRSNIAVARIVVWRARPTAGFLDIPLALRDPAGLAVLACIITATPGTAWARYDPASGVLTMHILDLVDEATWIATIQDRYERRLLEIFR